MLSNPFENWRSDKEPVFLSTPAIPQVDGLVCSSELKAEVRAHCIQQYQKAMQLMEHSVADVSLKYVTRNPSGIDPAPFVDKFRHDNKMRSENNPGALLHFANVYCQRYLDLYEAYIAWEMNKNIPMIPVTAGQMKLHGFTSEDIILMKEDCARYSEITDNIKIILRGNIVAYNQIIAAMTNMNAKEITSSDFINDATKRTNYLTPLLGNEATKLGAELEIEFRKYESLPQKEMINKAHFLMHDFGHLEYADIAMQLYYVGNMTLDKKAQEKERILMEIRHRVGGDMSIHQNSYGTLGGSPLAYLNVLMNGEKGNPEAEFREKMYFVYMNNHFANAVIRDQDRINFINNWLQHNQKEWTLDQDFIKAMQDRRPNYIPPIFRYGANAALNKQLREVRSHEAVAQFYKDNPNITIREVMEDLASINAYYRLKLSDRELFNQIGELHWRPEDANRTWERLNFGTGAAVFKVYEQVLSNMSDSAKKYINAVNDLGLPVFSGISGTLDQSTAMAGLVGLGVDRDLARRELELHTIKMAYLAFMLPGRDHSAHEILQSSTTFGLKYVAGPGYQHYLYPPDEAFILKEIQNEQERRGSHLPEYYLSAEYAQVVLEQKLKKPQSEDVLLPSKTVKPASTHSTKKEYYIGIPLFGTAMQNDLTSIIKTDDSITLVKPHDLHITIGWLSDEIKPETLKKMSKELSSIFEKYDDLSFSIKNVEMWDKDVIAVLNEEKRLQEMRKEIKDLLQKLKIRFEFNHTPHVTIAHVEEAKSNDDIQKTVCAIPPTSYSFEYCSLMHFDYSKWRTAKDFDYGFKKRAHQRKESIAQLETELKEYNDRRGTLLNLGTTQSPKINEGNEASRRTRPKGPGKKGH